MSFFFFGLLSFFFVFVGEERSDFFFLVFLGQCMWEMVSFVMMGCLYLFLLLTHPLLFGSLICMLILISSSFLLGRWVGIGLKWKAFFNLLVSDISVYLCCGWFLQFMSCFFSIFFILLWVISPKMWFVFFFSFYWMWIMTFVQFFIVWMDLWLVIKMGPFWFPLTRNNFFSEIQLVYYSLFLYIVSWYVLSCGDLLLRQMFFLLTHTHTHYHFTSARFLLCVFDLSISFHLFLWLVVDSM